MRPRPAHLPLLACLALAACARDPTTAERVILITCDTLRADRLGVYGNRRGLTPALDAFARECVVFDTAYSSAPMTQPAVSSLLTGRLPSEVGAEPGNLKLMPADVETFAERARAAGLETAAVVSNWILRRLPEQVGDVGVQQGFEHFDDHMGWTRGNRTVMERTARPTTRAAVDWLESRSSDRFFLWVHYQDPHGPYTPPPAYAARYHSPRGREAPVPLGHDKLGRGQIPDYQALAGERDPAVYRDRYDAEVRYFDEEAGVLLAWLRRQGLLDGALVVVSADHGEALGEHGYWFCHGESVYREIVRVPLLVRWPGGTVPASYPAPGPDGVRHCAALASHLDFVPTALEALDLARRGERGVSLLRRPPPPGRVLPQDLWPAEGRPRWWAASDERYRLVWSQELDGARLFDTGADPTEASDLAAAEPERAAELLQGYREFLAGGTRRDGEAMSLGPEERAALRSLGYTGGDLDGQDEKTDQRSAGDARDGGG